MEVTRLIKFWAGPTSLLVLLLLGHSSQEQMAIKVTGIILWMLIWWITEVVPMAVTSLLPIVLLPFFGVMKIEEVCVAYGNRFVFLFLGGFIIAIALEKWNLHRRLALNIVNKTGVSANRIILGFFAASYLVSMWISNTATALMMFPIGSSVVSLILGRGGAVDPKGAKNFAIVIMLSIAYGASIGGIATLVGSPPNAAMAAILSDNTFNTKITFFTWMKYGFPFSLVLFILSYFLLVKVVFPNRLGRFDLGHETIHEELRSLGKWRKQEVKIFVVFVVTAVLWISLDVLAPLLKNSGIQLTDAAVGLSAGILLFLIPGGNWKSKPILEWKDTEKLPWGVLLMFGGGLAIAKAFEVSGLVGHITHWMDFLDRSNIFIFAVILCAIGLALTALMSNLAMVTIFVPIVALLALGCGLSPLDFAIPVTIAASCDFMFPMSTPPNTIAYSSGYISATNMFRAGVVLNIASFLLLSLMMWMLL